MGVAIILMVAAPLADPVGNVAGSRVADTAVTAPGERKKQEEHHSEFSATLITAFGAGSKIDDSGLNRYGFGFGARAGVTFGSPRFYFGASFIRFLGDSNETGKYYTSTLDAEASYEVRLVRQFVFLRPELAIGVAQPVTIQFDNEGYPLTFHLAPGLLFGLRLAPVLVSLEVRQDFVPDDWANATTAMFGCGVGF